MITTPATERALCPRCNHHPKPARGEICNNCRAEEIADAAGQLPLGASAPPQGQPLAAPAPETEARQAAAPPPPEQRAEPTPPPQNGNGAKRAAAPRDMPARAGAPSSEPPRGEPPRRMGLANVQAKPTEALHKVGIYGPEGTGKTTFGQEAPDPIFLAPELSGTLVKSDTPRFPQPQSWRDLIEAIDELTTGQHSYKTIVVDTLDRVQDLAINEVIREWNAGVQQQRRANNIEEVGGGFQKGYVGALDKVRLFLGKLERLIERRRMHVVLIAHGQVRKISDPSVSDPFDQWDLALIETNQAPIAGTVRNWLDSLLFVNFDTRIVRDRKGRPTKRAESPADGDRVLYTQRSPGWRAKNRDGLARAMPFSWANYAAAVASSESPEYLREVIAEKVDELGDPAIADWVAAELKKEPPRQRLTQINLKLAARLEQQQYERAEEGQQGDERGGER